MKKTLLLLLLFVTGFTQAQNYHFSCLTDADFTYIKNVRFQADHSRGPAIHFTITDQAGVIRRVDIRVPEVPSINPNVGTHGDPSRGYFIPHREFTRNRIVMIRVYNGIQRSSGIVETRIFLIP